MKAGYPPNLGRLHARGPIEWAERIAALPAHQQVPVASIVWWDFFSRVTSAEAWPHLDFWVFRKMPADENPDETRAGLVALGYPERRARQRVHHAKHLCP